MTSGCDRRKQEYGKDDQREDAGHVELYFLNPCFLNPGFLNRHDRILPSRKYGEKE